MSGIILASALEIMGWLGIPEGEVSRERYREAREAGFALLMQHASSVGRMRQFLDLARAEDIKLMAWVDAVRKDPEGVADALKDHPALAMYHIIDEPTVQKMDELAPIVRRLAARDPKHPAYVNLLMEDAPAYMGCTNYTDYAVHAMRAFSGIAFSADFYPCAVSNRTWTIPYRDAANAVFLRPDWFEQLECVSGLARQYGRELWLFACNIAYDDRSKFLHPIPTLATLRVQQYANLAYGATLLQNFTYWEPDAGDPHKFHESIIHRDGKRGEVYDLVKKLNRELRARSWAFQGAKVAEVAHTGVTIPRGTHRLEKLPRWVMSLSTEGEGALVSRMIGDGREILMIVNRSPSREMALDIVFENGVRRVLEDGSAVAASAYSSRFWLPPGYAEIFFYDN